MKKKLTMLFVLFVLLITSTACGERQTQPTDLIVDSGGSNPTPQPGLPTPVVPATDVATLQAQVTALSAEVTDLTAQLAAAKANSGADPAEVTTLKAQVVDLQAKLDKANADLANVLVVNPADFDAVVYIKGALPMYQDLRTHVRTPGDTSAFLVTFAVDFPSVTLQRLVADDVLTGAVYYESPNAVGVDILPLLEMGPVTASEPADPALRSYLGSRGVNLNEGEILAQNYKSIFLGPVKAGAYFKIYFKDDPDLQVNSGGLISFSADTDPFTVTLQGVTMVNPTFVLAPTATPQP